MADTITAREAVERERKAFERGARFAKQFPDTNEYAQIAVFLYPLPTKPIEVSPELRDV